ncbi:MAG: glycosyltransferase family 4 protein [Enterobacterales bacterium]
MNKVLIVFHDSNVKSGATASMLDLLAKLMQYNELEVKALIPESGNLASELRKRKINFINRKFYSGRYGIRSFKEAILSFPKAALKLILTLCSFISMKNQFDDVDLVYVNTSDNYMGLLISIFLRKKTIFHIREFGVEDQNQKHVITDFFYYWLVNKFSSKVIVISDALKEKIEQRIDNNKLCLVYDDVNASSTKLAKKTNENAHTFVIVGTLCEGKGQYLAIKAFHTLINDGYDAYLRIIGADDNLYADYLKRVVTDCGLDNRVEFTGFIDEPNTVKFQQDICLVPSLSEAFGRVTIESMASGMVVIASDSGASKELIKEGVNGFLFTSGSVESLTEVLKKVIDTDLSDLNKIALNAELESKKYTSGHAAEKIFNIIEDVL